MTTFGKKVVYPSIRFGVLFLAALAIGFASWLETNESVDSCTFKNSLSFQQIHLYQNISSNLTTPDSVSIGLWKSCYFYSLNCTCSPTNIKYQPGKVYKMKLNSKKYKAYLYLDIQNILQIATQHLAVPPEATETSLSRFAPLIVATLFAGLAVVLGFIANSSKQYLFRRIICGFIVISLALTAYVFGSTFKSYQDSIKSTCKDPNNSIYCTKYAIGVEVPIFGVAIALLVLSLLFWFLSSGFLNTDEQQEEEEEDVRCCGCFFKSKPEPMVEESTRKQKKSTYYVDQYQPPPRAINELDAWQDADYYNNNYPEKPYYYEQQKKKYNSNNYSSARGHKSRVTSRHDDIINDRHHSKKHGYNKRAPSSQQLDHYQKEARGSNQHFDYYQQDFRNSSQQHLDYAHRNSNQYMNQYRTSPTAMKNSSTSQHVIDEYNQQPYFDYYQQDIRGSNQHLDVYPPSPADYFQQYNNKQRSHRKSQDSSLTFGGRRRSSAGKLMESRGNKTPTTMSPHPLLYNNDYSYEEGSSGSNNSSKHQVPVLNMPPLEHHPLNKKIIKDKRIQNYLQQSSTPTTSSTSTY